MNNTYSNTLQNNLSKHTVYNHEKYYGAIEDSFIRERSMVQLAGRIIPRLKSMKSLSNSFEYEAGKDVKPYYNNRIGINKSPTLLLSQMRKSFSSKQLSCSIQNKYETTKTEEVIMKRSLLNPESDHKILKNRAFSMQLKHAKLKKDKHDRLVNGSKSANLNKRLLNADIKKSRQSKLESKWISPFLSSLSTDCNLANKIIISSKNINRYGNNNTKQLKVMNIDRQFRHKNGIFGNIIPLPSASLVAVTARKNIMKTLNSCDGLQSILQQYNALLQLTQIGNKKRLGVKGTQFIKKPTLEDLMGLKLRPKICYQQPTESISEEVLITHCRFYQKYMKKDPRLTKRLIAGLCQEDKLFKAQAFIRFYNLFGSKAVANEEKVKFLKYFFIPLGKLQISYQTLKGLLATMCEQMPLLKHLNIETNSLTPVQKAQIFLEALDRVVFSGINDPSTHFTRESLQEIFLRNPEATDQMVRLLRIEEILL